MEVAVDDDAIRAKLLALEKKYAKTAKAKQPHPDVGCWWTIYDYGLDVVKTWDTGYKHAYPEEEKRVKDEDERKVAKAERRKAKAEALAAGVVLQPSSSSSSAATGRADASSGGVAGAIKDTPIAFLFPGQGSQSVGMLKESADLPAVKDMLNKAKEILGYDLLQLCNEGPKEKLDDTTYSQPALFVAGLAAVERLRSTDPAIVDSVSAAAGLSLGEYTALVFAGAMSFEDGLRVVKVRAESMAEAAKAGRPHGMLSVVGLNDPDLEAICAEVNKLKPDCVCKMANYLFPQGRVVSGHKEALEMVQKLATARGALKAVAVAVSGAFHTELMSPASDELVKALSKVTLMEPRVPVFSNVTGEAFTGAAHIGEMLPRQLVEPVCWEPSVRALIAAGKNEMYELGPGAQIKAMVKRIDPAAWKAFKNVVA